MADIGSGISYEFDWRPSLMLMASSFDTMGTSVKSMKEPLKDSIQQVINPSIAKNFAVGGRPAWRPLSPLTIYKKGHDRILIEKGTLSKQAPLLKSWTIKGTEGEAVMDQVSAVHGYYHQSGYINHRTGTWVGPREWAVIQEEDGDAVEEIFWKWIEERWDRDVAMGRI